ncbi:hypothetical protein Rhopal_003584-T1 [Rhodotorula paludigena]|uniref:Chromo domain-containing protein n=1 Tax=Rhodotorula paludigena TaxID=86838 RepID=A0AAV5GM72_9BASI|nr:hypothetical protein Rhopal_003584-T1 [Rhodotorula paludigena]
MPRSPEPQLVPRSQDPADSGSESSGGEDEGVYEVEAIRAARYDEEARAMRYFIKWKGYGEDEKTWEPIENLQNCLDLVKAFGEQQKANKRKLAEKKARLSVPPTSSTPVLNDPAARPSSPKDLSDDGVPLTELESRREKAKQKARDEGAPKFGGGRVESAVADKWEKKASAKKPRNSPVASTSRGLSAARSATKKRTNDDEVCPPSHGDPYSLVDEYTCQPASPPGKKPKQIKKLPRIAALPDSSSDDEESSDSAASGKGKATQSKRKSAPPAPPESPASLAKPEKPSSAPPVVKPVPVPVSSDPRLRKPTPVAQRAPSADALAAAPPPPPPIKTGPQGAWALPGLTKLMGKSFKKPPPPPPPVPLPAVNGAADSRGVGAAGPAPPSAMRQQVPVNGPSGGEQTAAHPAAHADAPPRVPTPVPPAHGASPAPPTGDGSEPAAAAQSPAVEQQKDDAAEKAAVQASARAQRIAGMESRLLKTPWCIANPIFEQEALPVACAESIPIDAHLARRLKGKGVAVLFNPSRDTDMSGEGLALGYLLTAMGANTPDSLAAVEAVFIHRHETYGQLDNLYVELVNLNSHVVEFFRFGGGEPVESVFAAGYLVIPTLAAIQRASAYERFCQTIRDIYARTCQLLVHPATLAHMRTKPNWFNICERMNNTAVDIIDRQDLRIESTFAAVEKTVLLQPSATWPPSIPQMDAARELDEIISHTTFVRSRDPAKYRRFFIVVDELRQEDVDLARRHGIEVATWQTLSDRIKESPFG